MRTISYGKQDISESDINAVVRVLGSDWLTQGPEVPRFEKAVADRTGAEGAVAFNSATSALHAACLALDLGPGDRLWTSPITFVASANVGRWCGADVDFIDIEPLTGNLCLQSLQRKLTEAEARGSLPKIVMPVHFAGQPCDLEPLYRLAQRYGFKIIEDASHALGASYRETKIGGCRYSDITVFSFHPVKMITTGEGGMALSHSSELIDKMKRIGSHGIDRSAATSRTEPWRYDQVDLGLNYRMTEMQAALGSSQLTRLDEFIATRQKLANRYSEMFHGTVVRPLHQHAYGASSWHLFVVLMPDEDVRLMAWEALRAEHINAQIHYVPVPMQPYWKRCGATSSALPNAMAYYRRCLSLPLHCQLNERDQDRVVNTLLNLSAISDQNAEAGV